ncbi:hypothetical protein BT69DRAFT_1338249 [Atractiella rhizophila]|nr:hypothetical protein BT69DRAFT_1338249 [Atractiella rhizophila]
MDETELVGESSHSQLTPQPLPPSPDRHQPIESTATSQSSPLNPSSLPPHSDARLSPNRNLRTASSPRKVHEIGRPDISQDYLSSPQALRSHMETASFLKLPPSSSPAEIQKVAQAELQKSKVELEMLKSRRAHAHTSNGSMTEPRPTRATAEDKDKDIFGPRTVLSRPPRPPTKHHNFFVHPSTVEAKGKGKGKSLLNSEEKAARLGVPAEPETPTNVRVADLLGSGRITGSLRPNPHSQAGRRKFDGSPAGAGERKRSRPRKEDDSDSELEGRSKKRSPLLPSPHLTDAS